jgi:roadblock/LC7 domain-containing protein
MTPREVFETAVHAGIYTEDGKLTGHYAEPADEDSSD